MHTFTFCKNIYPLFMHCRCSSLLGCVHAIRSFFVYALMFSPSVYVCVFRSEVPSECVANMWETLYSILTFYFRLITFCHAFLPFTRWKSLPHFYNTRARCTYTHTFRHREKLIDESNNGFGHTTQCSSSTTRQSQ